MSDILMLTAEELAVCKRLYAAGISWEEIAKAYKVPADRLARAVKRAFVWDKGTVVEDPCKGCKWILNGVQACCLPRCMGK